MKNNACKMLSTVPNEKEKLEMFAVASMVKTVTHGMTDLALEVPRLFLFH